MVSKVTPRELIDWLDTRLVERGWTDYALAKRAGLSHTVISKARSGIRPGWEACTAIAKALDVSPEVILRMAGLLPKPPGYDAGLEELTMLYGQMSADVKEEFLRWARLRLELDVARRGKSKQ